jgi:type I restriction enzyme S subunit
MNVPALRFKDDDGQEFPEWEVKLFGDIFTFIQTNSFSRVLLNYDYGIVKNIHYGDIHTKYRSNFKIRYETVPFINSDVDITNISSDCYCKEGDLIIADASEDYADIGKSIEIINTDNQKLLAGLHTYIARDLTHKMSLGFSGYLMQTESVRLQIKTLATGISVLGISKVNLRKVKLNIPSLPEQTKIANFLTAVDDKITLLTKKADLLSQYKKGVMQQIFSQELRFKDDDGQEFPEWEEKDFNDVFHSISTKQFQILNSEISKNGKFKVVDQGQNDIAGYSNDENKIFTDLPVVIFGDHTTVLKYIDFKFVIGADGTKLLKQNFGNLKFLYYCLVFNKIETEGYKRHYSILKEIKLFIPESIEEQTKIANFLTAFDEKITNNQTQLDAVKQYKQGLLQQMFV